ncbi:MAG TPA: MFS transporter [Bacteroidales bacterium]|nr:MFS transporter [Bacteroidales bacterium]HPR73109.1 MFS transporter [Bacteroidales bacterium]HRW85166.1 MFS transporter [Bacteroidales bacterium]
MKLNLNNTRYLKSISRTIWILSIVSLLTDTASEMLYPILPIYLKTIGFSVALIGILEGIAEAIAGLSKGYFGKLSDISGKRVPFVQMGYFLSAIAKPMMAVFIYPLWIFFSRTLDRFGKGIRTGARDAILSEQATPETKGTIFGFHRSMDTFGAVLGPLLALLYLYFHPQNYRTLFFIAFLPGFFAILTSFLLKDKAVIIQKPNVRTSFFSFLKYWTVSSADYKKLVTGLLIFALVNSSDVFLLLKAKQGGLDDTIVIMLYVFYNLIYALFAFPLGIIGDRIGLKKILIFGLILFSLVYSGMSVNENTIFYYVLFFLFGVYAAATEGVSKAWIANITLKKDVATAIGTFAGLQSICTMIASTLTGLIWLLFGAATALICTAVVTLIVAAYLMTVPNPSNNLND